MTRAEFVRHARLHRYCACLPYLKVRDRQPIPRFSGLVLYVQACNPTRRGRSALQLLESRRGRTAAHRCPATRKIETPEPRGFAIAANLKAGTLGALLSLGAVSRMSQTPLSIMRCGRAYDCNHMIEIKFVI